MTRDELLKEYNVNARGFITDPGKFEGEMLYAPYFYDALMNGGADEETEDGVAVFNVTDEDRKQFPELINVEEVRLNEDDQGFVTVSYMEKTTD